ncbi:UNVERIFIED_CONTAM: hypothetical protein FKN15_010036 [Acipenser sinensis]
MPHARTRNPIPISEVTWDSGLKEMNETWKGAVACLGVAIFFVMTIGVIYWQVVDQPSKNWILKGSFSGLIWDRRTHSLIIQTLTEDKTFVEIDVGNFPALEVPFVKNLCWLNKTEFCYTWDSIADLKISLESEYSPGTECYSIHWIPLHCQVDLKLLANADSGAKVERELRTFFNRLKRHKLGEGVISINEHSTTILSDMALEPPKTLAGDEYISLFAEIAAKIGNSSIITAGTRSNHLPLFVRMSPLQSDWSYSGIKGIIPSILHYSLLGYNFFIPDAVGGSLSSEFVTDEELFIRWLQIATFLPVISFRTPPWVCGDRVLNLTRSYILKHQDSVVPLIIQYAEEWVSQGRPVFRPVWWISPEDPVTYTIDDEFLIGDEVLVAPVTERGEVQRDIYLPGSEYQWMDTNNGKVFDGGTLLENYSVPLEDVAVFQRRSS